MYPYRWNAYVIRTYLPAAWTPITLAAEIQAVPGRFVVDGVPGIIFQCRTCIWVGGDRGWTTGLFYPLPAPSARWPYGLTITERLLPLTGPP